MQQKVRLFLTKNQKQPDKEKKMKEKMSKGS